MTAWVLDRDRLAYGLRTALGAALALALAWALGLEHPQWAGMTVWAASQPVRAHLIEKSAFRGVGTLVGAVFGALLAGLAARTGGGPALLVAGAALWLGLCAAAGNLLRGFAGYGAMLAGYTAVMVALLDSGHPQDVLPLALDRTATVLTGILVALGIGLLLTPRGAEAEIPRRLRRSGAGVLRDVAAALRRPAPADEAALALRLAELARLDEEIDGEGAGSLAARREARSRRETVMAQVAVLLWLRARAAETRPDPARAAAVAAIAALYDAAAPAPERRAALARAARGAEPDLRRALADLGAALPRRDEGPAPDRPPAPLALHRDWTAAREAGVRAALAMLAIGAVWVATGWAGGPMVMLGTAIMTSVFSTSDNPFAILPKVAMGQALGAALAIACRWLVWPHLGGEAAMILAMLPFILLGGVMTGVPRLQIQAFDYNMVLLLLLQPAWPLGGDLRHALGVGAAVASAPLVAWLAFRLIHPPSAARRGAALLGAMVREVEAMAARPEAAPVSRLRRARRWRARLHHRLLRLIRWTERSGGAAEAAARAGLALLLAGQAVLAMEARLADPALGASGRRRLLLACARCAALGRAPGRAARALAAAARLGGRDAPLLAAAAEALGANAAFLAAASGPIPAARASPGGPARGSDA